LQIKTAVSYFNVFYNVIYSYNGKADFQHHYISISASVI